MSIKAPLIRGAAWASVERGKEWNTHLWGCRAGAAHLTSCSSCKQRTLHLCHPPPSPIIITFLKLLGLMHMVLTRLILVAWVCSAAGVFWLPVAPAPVLPRELEQYSFDDYIREFEKVYASAADYLEREANFQRTKHKVVHHNSNPDVSFLLGLNTFADMDEAEISAFLMIQSGREAKQRRSGMPALSALHVPPQLTAHGRDDAAPSRESPLSRYLPTSAPDKSERGNGAFEPLAFTWQQHDPPVLTPVKTQGLCSSCWAHAAAEAVESAMAIRFGSPARSVSVEQITACANNTRRCGGGGGCLGGTVQVALTYAAATEWGLLSNESYPYTSGTKGITKQCLLDPAESRDAGSIQPEPIARVRGHVQVERNNAAATRDALLRRGPLAVAVDASDWIFYHSGIFSGCAGAARAVGRGEGGLISEENITINHAVQLVGYGVDADTNTNFWIVRNSWGVGWGESGYMRLWRAAQGHGEQCAFVNDWNEVGGGCADDPVTDIVACGTCGILFDVVYPVVAAVAVPGGAQWWLPFTLFGALAAGMGCLVTYTSCAARRRVGSQASN